MKSKAKNKAIMEMRNHIAVLEKENADLQKSYEELYNSMRVIKEQRNELEKRQNMTKEGFSTWFKETFHTEDCLNNAVFTRQSLKDAWDNGYAKGKEELKEELKEKSQCSDQCKHCTYIEEGDFICDVTQDVTIVGWKPFPCACPKKRRLNK